MDETRRAFLRNIADNPDDDTPRLVYADLLLERGEMEHAEMIRVQCELSKTKRTIFVMVPVKQRNGSLYQCDEKDADGHETREIKNPAYKSLEDRERKLLAWPTDHLMPAPWIGRCKWDRGFVSSVQIESKWLVQCGWAWDRHPIHTVRLLDWDGVEKSLPANPREVMWSLKRLELPESAMPNRIGNGFSLIHLYEDYHRWSIDCLPGVELMFWDDSNPKTGMTPIRLDR